MKNKITITLTVGKKAKDGCDTATVIVYEDLGYASHSVPYHFKNGGEEVHLFTNGVSRPMSTRMFIKWCISQSLRKYKLLAKSYGGDMAVDL